MGFMEYMNEKHAVNRWEVFKIGLIGAICGAAAGVVFVLGGFGA